MPVFFEDIEPGRSYAAGDRVREIIRMNDHAVLYREYDLKTGEPVHRFPQRCSRWYFFEWAKREASAAEARRLDREKAEIVNLEGKSMVIRAILDRVSNQTLLAEVKRRGLRLPEGRRKPKKAGGI